jgi:regulator of protease activity HflC (stomatin/prohibitin superfamily)
MIVTIVLVVLAVLVTTGIALAAASVRVLREYERGIVFRLGRVTDQRGPGLILLIPAVDRMVRVSLRTVTLRIPAQEVITRDNVPARVTAVAYYRVIEPTKSVIEIEDVLAAVQQIAQTTLRSVLGKVDLDSLLSERERLNEQLQQIIDDQTEPWGVKVTVVEIKDVEIPERMQHAIARQAEAERERRAKVINAEGEFQAAARLNDAAVVISRNPVTIQLRYLQTLREVSGNQSSTIVLPLTMDALRPVAQAVGGAAGGGGAQGASQAELDEALASARLALEAANEADPATATTAALGEGTAAEQAGAIRRRGAAEQGEPGASERERERQPSTTPEPARFAREPEHPPDDV